MTKLLIVDDNLDLLDVMEIGLRGRFGYEVITASDGLKGLERAIADKPDCIVIDVKMPGLNGNQLVLVLRGDAATKDIPLVMLTAMAQEKDQFIGIASGADQYLVKPQTPAAIHEAVQRALGVSLSDRTERLQHLAERSDGALTPPF